MRTALKLALLIALFPLGVLMAAVLLLIHKVGRFIEDIYDDDMYWGGKE